MKGNYHFFRFYSFFFEKIPYHFRENFRLFNIYSYRFDKYCREFLFALLSDPKRQSPALLFQREKNLSNPVTFFMLFFFLLGKLGFAEFKLGLTRKEKWIFRHASFH